MSDRLCIAVFMFFMAFMLPGNIIAQDPESPIKTIPRILGDTLIEADTIPERQDTTGIAPKDTVKSDSISEDSYQSDIETTIDYSAKDSIIFNTKNRMVWLYGDANIDYGNIKLSAARIEIDWDTNTLTATGIVDSTGKRTGTPVFQEGQEVYETREIKYNFQTQKAFIKGVVTQQGEGYMHGNQVKMNEKNELFIRNAKYTTCNLAHPHFYIRSSRIKVIPDDKIVSGPFNLEVEGVPTPLGFPFGMFPSERNRTSGVIFPTYGEESRRGFFMRNGGYFFALNDYVNLEVTGDIYTKGSWGFRLGSQYRKRYAFSGNFTFNFTTQKIGEIIEEPTISRDFRISWSHTPQTSGTGRFSANVNAVTSSYNQNNALDVVSNSRSTFSSNVSYSKTFKGTPFSLGLNSRFTQNVQTKDVTLMLPEFSLNMRNIYPFQKAGSSGNTWYERISLKWSMTGTNQVRNKIGTDSIAPFDLETIPELIRQSRKGIRHQIPISTSVTFLKHFRVSPSVNYMENWYFEKLNYQWDEELGKVVTDTISGFNRIFEYSGGISITTRLYGTHFFNGNKIEAIRHVVNPSLSLSYRPDFSAEKFDFYQEVQTKADGTTKLMDRYQNFVYGSPGRGESQTLGFGISNNLELKVRNPKDTTNQTEKVKLFNNLRVSSSYNFLADSINLGNISFNANTSLFKRKLSVNLSGRVDPYIHVLDSIDAKGRVYQRRLSRFSWNEGRGIGQLTFFNLSLSTNLNPKAQNTQKKIEESDATEAEKEYLLKNPDAYVDFNIPWSLRASFSFNYRKIGFQEPDLKESLRLSGDFSLTPKTKIGFTSGYDFEQNKITDTSFNISKDLHCWTMQFNWRPFGRFESFSFTIRAKSTLLQDLKIERKSNFFDNF